MNKFIFYAYLKIFIIKLGKLQILMKNILRKNSIYGIAQALINLLFVFFAIPVFIKILGSEAYGVFALVMVIGNLNTFTNLGLTSALVKFIAEQGKTEESNIDIIVNLILMLIAVLPLTLIALILVKFVLLFILKVPIYLFEEAKGLYFWILWANFLLIIGQVFRSILDALQKVYITSLQQAVYNILYWGLILIALFLGFNLKGVGLSIFISALIWFVTTFISSIKEWGNFSFNGLSFSFKVSAKKQLNYGIKIYSAGMISFFYEPITKVLISNLIGISEVGFYDIALKIRSQIWGFIAKIFYPLFPFISAQKDINIVRKYVHELEQKMFYVVIPLITIVILIMHPFIELWIGNNVDIISITAIFIISFHLIGSTVIPQYQFLMAKNLAQKTLILQLSNVVFNTIFFLIAVYFIGYYALIIGNVAAILSSFILSLYYQKKYLNSLIFDSTIQVTKLFLLFLCLLLIGYVMKGVLIGHSILIITIIPISLSLLTIFLFKLFNLIKIEDIHRYFGYNNIIAKTLIKIYN